jgi:Escherichia/Staphylococcus phage prohead protease
MSTTMNPTRSPRERKALAFAFDAAQEGEFEGYASVFGIADQGHDIVAPGAFRRSLRARGTGGVKLLFQHDAREPIGVWRDIREDAHGLSVRGRILPELQRGHDVLALMRAGALDGLSIGYQVVRSRTDRKTGTRTLIDVDLWEISIVTFPLLPAARVTRVKRRGTPRAAARFGAADRALAEAMRRFSDDLRKGL